MGSAIGCGPCRQTAIDRDMFQFSNAPPYIMTPSFDTFTVPEEGVYIALFEFIRNKYNNTFCLTVKDLAQPFQCVQSDGLIMLQIVNRSGVQAVFMN